MKNTSTKSVVMRWRKWLVMLLLLAGSMTGYAQSNCFTYEDEGKTITGLTYECLAATSLTIPKEVTKVQSGAFEMATNDLTSLYIENGGNPTFESGLFGENANTLTMIDMGNGMSVANMIALLQSLGTFKEGTEIEANGFTGEKDITSETWDAVTWTNVAFITLPAELIGELTIIGQDGKEKTVHEGEAVVEMVNTIHHGENRGSKPVILYMFYLSQEGLPLAVQHPEIPLD